VAESDHSIPANQMAFPKRPNTSHPSEARKRCHLKDCPERSMSGFPQVPILPLSLHTQRFPPPPSTTLSPLAAYRLAFIPPRTTTTTTTQPISTVQWLSSASSTLTTRRPLLPCVSRSLPCFVAVGSDAHFIWAGLEAAQARPLPFVHRQHQRQ
jgi:hypothetical protein